MNTLRQEIFDILKNDVMFYRAETLTIVILSLVEKRINAIPSKHDSNTVEEVNYTNGWNHALYEVKKELLKS